MNFLYYSRVTSSAEQLENVSFNKRMFTAKVDFGNWMVVRELPTPEFSSMNR